MHALFLIRNNLSSLSGGDKIQIEETQRAVEALGIRVTLGHGNRPSLEGVDIVHIFNPSLISPQVIQYIREHKIPIVVSTIHWNMREYFTAMLRENNSFLTERPTGYLGYYIENEIRGLLYRYVWNGLIEKKLRDIFSQADLLLPNSQAEADLLVRDFHIPAAVCQPIVNGITPVPQNTTNDFKIKHQLGDFVLCVGRIEYRKNQAQLIRAMERLPYDLVFIGRPFNRGYTALCKKIASKRRGKTLFLDHAPQSEVYTAYRSARVHALVSWYETPGLASLEAGSCGANLVVSDRGCTQEYFGSGAHYCQPNEIGSITTAIEHAWREPKNTHLQEQIDEKYTWDVAAQQTIAAYKSVIV